MTRDHRVLLASDESCLRNIHVTALTDTVISPEYLVDSNFVGRPLAPEWGNYEWSESQRIPSSYLAELASQLSTIAKTQPRPSPSLREQLSSGITGLVFLSLLLLAAYGYWRSWRNDQIREQAAKSARAEKENATRTAIEEFARKNAAVTDWRQGLTKEQMSTHIYSASVANLLVREDGRPVLLLGSVRDVSSVAAGFIIDFDVSINAVDEVRVRLHSSAEQAQLVQSNSKEREGRYAFVARIQNVQSVEEHLEDEFGEPELSVATGVCVDLMPVGSYIGDYRDMDLIHKN